MSRNFRKTEHSKLNGSQVQKGKLFVGTRSSLQWCDVEWAIFIVPLTWFFSAPRRWSMPFKPTTASVLLWNMLTEARWDLVSQSHGDTLMSLAVSGGFMCSLKQTGSMSAHLLPPLSALFPHVTRTSVYRRPGTLLRCRDCISPRVPPFTWRCIPRSKGELTLCEKIYSFLLNLSPHNVHLASVCGIQLFPAIIGYFLLLVHRSVHNSRKMPIILRISHYFVILS